ncbi:MAG TPA: GspH/FimT family pseudopilin [Steroidobacteraceae bacterium]|nr:GspH/FimT family pseudopilin [Steroidobacteraceae bacterium]HRX91013.1 GspH/FimT family pseudopilin [Steroidobacteraceae bacterium]
MRELNEQRAGRCGGVTLVELLAALAILAILVTVAVPGFRHMSRRAAVLVATHDLMSALHATRAASITRGRPGVVCLTGADNVCLRSTADSAIGYQAWIDQGGSLTRLDPGDTLLLRAQLPGELQLRGSRASVTFWPIARAGTTNTFSICDLATLAPPAQVIVSQSGRPRLGTSSRAANCG